MAPIKSWHKNAQPFSRIYNESRILNEIYFDRSTDDRNVVAALVEWDIAFPDPLNQSTRKEVGEDLLKELVVGPADLEGVKLRDHEFSQVALLSTEVIQHCGTDTELATLLFGFVLHYLAPNDGVWKDKIEVVAKRGSEEVPLRIRNAIWIADLKRQRWVPFEGVDGVENVAPLQPAHLTPLLENQFFQKEWLFENNSAVDLLIECFGFDVLHLRLQSLPPETKSAVAERLAQLVQIGGGSTEFYQKLVSDIEEQKKRQQEKERNRQFGIAVQNAIEQYLDELGLDVDIIDNGYELDVEVPDELSTIDAGSHHCAVGPYKVEIKATTTGEVRLTPKQAEVASESDQFILCVVDLRACDAERIAQPWNASDVQPLALIVSGLRESVNETHELVEEAGGKEIAIRNTGKLRYGVPTAIWEHGFPIKEWVEKIAPVLSEPVETSKIVE